MMGEHEYKKGEKRWRGGTQNSPRATAGTRRDDGIFITTRFALGIILGTFSRELSGGRGKGEASVRVEFAGNEFACRQHVLSTASFVFHIASRFANAENML